MIGGLLFALTIVCLFVVPSESVGVTVSTHAKVLFQELKMEQKYRYIIYYITEDKEIDVESTGDPNLTTDDLLQEFKSLEDESRYIIYDQLVDNGRKIILIKWVPETANVKQKLLYNSGYEAIKRALVGVHKYLRASELNEVEEALNGNSDD